MSEDGSNVVLGGVAEGFGYTIGPLLEHSILHFVPSVIVASADVSKTSERVRDDVLSALRKVRVNAAGVGHGICVIENEEITGPRTVMTSDLMGCDLDPEGNCPTTAVMSYDNPVCELKEGETINFKAEIRWGRSTIEPDETAFEPIGHIGRGPMSVVSYRIGSEISSTGEMMDTVVFEMTPRGPGKIGGYVVRSAATLVYDMLENIFSSDNSER